MKIIRNNPTRTGLLSIFICIALSVSSLLLAQDEAPERPKAPIINKIYVNFTGFSNVSEEVVRVNMSLREGEEFDQVSVDRDIHTLYRTGYFEFIEVRIKPVDGGRKTDVFYDIRPKFRIASIQFDGNEKVKDRRLLKETELEVNRILNERQVKEGAEKLKELYIKRGYPRVRIDYDIERNAGTGFGNIVYRVREGGKFKVKKVRFDGNEEVKARKLRKSMETRKKGFFSIFTGSGKYDADVFEDDLETLRDVYRNEGYLDIDIDPANVNFSYPSKKRMIIEIGLEEGKQYQVGNIEFEGNEIYPEETLQLLLRVTPGTTYRPEKIDEDKTRIEDFYGQFGYMETRIRLERVPNLQTGNIDLIYHLYESEKFYVESIDIEGNTKTKSVVVLRELALGPGSVFDSVRMDASRLRLENTRFFEDASVSPQSTNIPGRKDLKVSFREGRTGNFSFGAGFSSLENAVFFVELTQSNFDIFNWRGAFQGDGQKFRVKAQIGSESNQVVLAFEEPWLFERRLALGFQIFSQSIEYTSSIYDQESKGIDVYLRKRLIELIEGRLTLGTDETEFTDINLDTGENASDFDLFEREFIERSSGVVNRVNLLLLRDTRDRLLNTFRGARYELDLTSAGGPLGGDFDFYKVESRNAFYLPLSNRMTQTVEFLVRAGAMVEYDDSTFVPLDEVFYLGGPNTLRGFEFREVGPTNSFGTRVGGKSYGMFSAEYSIGFAEGFRGAIFYDGGFVNKAAGDFSLERQTEVHGSGIQGSQANSGWNDNWGFGLRISVLGTPLRLDYGIPITTDLLNDNGGQFNFTFGGRF